MRVRPCAAALAPAALSPCAQDVPLEVRQSAGLLLKNNLRSWARLEPLVQAYVKARGGGATRGSRQCAEPARAPGVPAVVPGPPGALPAHHSRHRHQVRARGARSAHALRYWRCRAALNPQRARAPRRSQRRGRLRRRPDRLAGAGGGRGARHRRRQPGRRGRRAGRAVQGARSSRCASSAPPPDARRLRRCARRRRRRLTRTWPACPHARLRCCCRGCWRCLPGAQRRRTRDPTAPLAELTPPCPRSPHLQLRKRAVGWCARPRARGCRCRCR